MIRRPRRTVAAALVAVVLLVGCVLLALTAIQMLAGTRALLDYRAIVHTMHGWRWNDPVVLAIGAAVAFVGLVLLVAALLPGRATILPLRDVGTGTVAGASRRSLRTTLRTAVGEVVGVDSVRIKVGRRKLRATVRTGRDDHDRVAESVHDALERRLGQLELARAHQPRIRIRAVRTPT